MMEGLHKSHKDQIWTSSFRGVHLGFIPSTRTGGYVLRYQGLHLLVYVMELALYMHEGKLIFDQRGQLLRMCNVRMSFKFRVTCFLLVVDNGKW